MKVMKFGGATLADADRISGVAGIIQRRLDPRGTAVVLSAPGGMTDRLIALIGDALAGGRHRPGLENLSARTREIGRACGLADLPTWADAQFERLADLLDSLALIGECPESVYAELASWGERLSVRVMAGLLERAGREVQLLEPLDLLVVRDDGRLDLDETCARLAPLAGQTAAILLMPGFAAATPEGRPTTLGRNGSDYSAAALVAGLGADACEIWTDVDGVFEADPRLVPRARLLPELSYQEAMELAYFGATVLHPNTLLPIARHQVPVRILNTDSPDGEGTLIHRSNGRPKPEVCGLTWLDDLVMVSVSGPGMKGMVGMASRTFEAIADVGASVVLITQSSSEYEISFCLHARDRDRVVASLHREFELELAGDLLEPIEVIDGLGVITLVGEGMRTRKGVAARFFGALAAVDVNVAAIAQGSSEVSISAVIAGPSGSRAVLACHEQFFDPRRKLDVFLVGCGLVGGAFLEQVRDQAPRLREDRVHLQVVGLARSSRMVLDPAGADGGDWRGRLAASPLDTDLEEMIAFARRENLTHPILVDCTADEGVARRYPEFLAAGFHVVTANKKANTLERDFYAELRRACAAHRRKFLYETNVGAGLPVIDNLQHLLQAGDRLEGFTGILSGALSCIFGLLDEGLSFSEATRRARDLGFTEPDPRDDLSGMDVARKLLILAREAGFSLDLQDVVVEPLCRTPDQVGPDADLWSELEAADAAFADRVAAAASDGSVLRYVASISADGSCRVGVRPVPPGDPLHTVRDGENALSFTTRYYQPHPLVLRGYGAGATVTAAGVFADVLRTLPWGKEV